MSQNENDTNGQTITECYKCHNLIPSSKFIWHVRQCCSTKCSRENPYVDKGKMLGVDADTVFCQMMKVMNPPWTWMKAWRLVYLVTFIWSH